MDTAQWPQGVRPSSTEKKPRPEKEQALNCPRCNSTNTKFCYYNNYSLSQPRYFCKTCRRYWTEGGTLRNVPVGGGSRKNKRSSSSSTVSSSKKLNTPDLSPPTFSPQQNPKIHGGQDLSLAYSSNNNNNSHHTMFQEINMSEFVSLPFGLDPKINLINPQNPSNPNYMSVSNYSVGFDIPQDDQFKPSLSFILDGLENISNGFGNNNNSHLRGVEEHANASPSVLSRTLFPFEELKPISTNDHQFDLQDRGQGDATNVNGYWNGMMLAPGGNILGQNTYI